ncbi:hypothetical protein D3C78_1517620 [compost metagenome]
MPSSCAAWRRHSPWPAARLPRPTPRRQAVSPLPFRCRSLRIRSSRAIMALLRITAMRSPPFRSTRSMAASIARSSTTRPANAPAPSSSTLRTGSSTTSCPAARRFATGSASARPALHGKAKPISPGSRNGRCGTRRRNWRNASRKWPNMSRLAWARA